MEIEEISFIENNENSTFSDQFTNNINLPPNILPYFLKNEKIEKNYSQNLSDQFFTNLNFIKNKNFENNKNNSQNSKIPNISQNQNFTKNQKLEKNNIFPNLKNSQNFQIQKNSVNFLKNEIPFNEDILQQNNESILVHEHISNNSISFDEDEYGTYFFNKNGEKIYFETTDSDNDGNENTVEGQVYYSDN